MQAANRSKHLLRRGVVRGIDNYPETAALRSLRLKQFDGRVLWHSIVINVDAVYREPRGVPVREDQAKARVIFVSQSFVVPVQPGIVFPTHDHSVAGLRR